MSKTIQEGGDIDKPFMSLGSGLRRALFVVFVIRGCPCTIRGSFIKDMSSFAGAADLNVSEFSLYSGLRSLQRVGLFLTSGRETAVITREILLASTA